MTSDQQPLRRADFIGGVWHGVLLAIGMTLVDPNAVLPGFIIDLTRSSRYRLLLCR